MSKHIDGTLVVDIDGTLCDIKKKDQSYSELVPYQPMLDKLREYQSKGYTILLYTARNMKTHEGNLGLINRHTAPVLLEWLEKWNVPYDEILFGKPWPRKHGFYIDDRAVRPNEFLTMSEDEIHTLLGQE
ncbi:MULTISPECIES: HAD family hydrolase [Dickeya]|uniref:Capsular polysaccharide biosynthesis protein, putative n=1 Tax=Dickeya aquatica TaxID=1401087 RepID=A0A375A6M9_9GAMM|nr:MULTISPECIES: capsular biosynthesis protein [Dickeya]SLM61576.1 capsular polysaccharide biosynthesis protein, putative [Dickeya aquatica]